MITVSKLKGTGFDSNQEHCWYLSGTVSRIQGAAELQQTSAIEW